MLCMENLGDAKNLWRFNFSGLESKQTDTTSTVAAADAEAIWKINTNLKKTR